MRIGCQNHTHAKWTRFKDLTIAKMHGGALEFWTEHKSYLLHLCDSHRAKLPASAVQPDAPENSDDQSID